MMETEENTPEKPEQEETPYISSDDDGESERRQSICSSHEGTIEEGSFDPQEELRQSFLKYQKLKKTQEEQVITQHKENRH